MATHQGSCHCGRVRFEVDAEITQLSECNCSLCQRKGALYVSAVDRDRVRIVSGESELAIYQFGSGTATHLFCRHCGIHPFHHPRVRPDGWSVNARCLEDYEQLRSLPIRHFDGQNWEKAAAKLRESRLPREAKEHS
jgi:hypothetical protein